MLRASYWKSVTDLWVPTSRPRYCSSKKLSAPLSSSSSLFPVPSRSPSEIRKSQAPDSARSAFRATQTSDIPETRPPEVRARSRSNQRWSWHAQRLGGHEPDITTAALSLCYYVLGFKKGNISNVVTVTRPLPTSSHCAVGPHKAGDRASLGTDTRPGVASPARHALSSYHAAVLCTGSDVRVSKFSRSGVWAGFFGDGGRRIRYGVQYLERTENGMGMGDGNGGNLMVRDDNEGRRGKERVFSFYA